MDTNKENQVLLQNLAQLRRHYGLSKAKMAKVLGISVASWNKIENGILPKRLSTRVLFRAQAFFKIPVSDLFREHGEKNSCNTLFL